MGSVDVAFPGGVAAAAPLVVRPQRWGLVASSASQRAAGAICATAMPIAVAGHRGPWTRAPPHVARDRAAHCGAIWPAYARMSCSIAGNVAWVACRLCARRLQWAAAVGLGGLAQRWVVGLLLWDLQ